MWKNVEQDARDDNTLRRMRTACWITKATGTQTCHTYCLSTATVVARTDLYVTFIRTLLVLLKRESLVLPQFISPIYSRISYLLRFDAPSFRE